MQSKGILYIFIACSLITSCSHKLTHYVPVDAPPVIFIPENQELALVSPPPLMILDNQNVVLENIGTQYFRIAVLPCIDMTGKSVHLKNSLADIFYTALFETKRFDLMDRGEVMRIVDVNWTDLDIDSTIVSSTLIETKKELYDKSLKTNEQIIKHLQSNTDGILQIYITSNKKAARGKMDEAGIDYRIVSTGKRSGEHIVLFAGSKNISYKYNKKLNSLDLDREDINEIAKEIKEEFPNPDLQTDLKIINKVGNKITVNAGKEDNIIAGMLGYVIMLDTDLIGNQTISYRALFEVTEVFSDYFNAELISNSEGDRIIIKTIKKGELVKMK